MQVLTLGREHLGTLQTSENLTAVLSTNAKVR